MTALRPGRRAAPGRLRRRVSTGFRLAAALALAGGVYTAFTPASQAEDAPPLSTRAQQGRDVYTQSCITCHGVNAEGVPGRGPSLIGVGSAAVEFQVGTGRMPLAAQGVQAPRKKPALSADDARALGQYVQELGGGPQLPPGDNLRASGGAAIAAGGELFRINCAACHAFAAGGGALSSGRYAPSLGSATDRQIYAAMLTGPQNMPVFGDNELTPDQKREIIAYIQHLKEDPDPGGFGMGRYGPVPEALAVFLVGMVILIFTTVWIAGKS